MSGTDEGYPENHMYYSQTCLRKYLNNKEKQHEVINYKLMD